MHQVDRAFDEWVGRSTVKRPRLDKAAVYNQLGLRLTYQPDAKTVIADAQPSAIMYKTLCPRGDLNPHALSGTSTSS